MAWTIAFKKKHFKFLKKQSPDTQKKIKTSLNKLLDFIDKGIFPFSEMDLKKLRGELKGFMRLRVGKIRIVFKVDSSLKQIKVYYLDFRGDVYKS